MLHDASSTQACLVVRCQYCPQCRKMTLTVANLLTYLFDTLTVFLPERDYVTFGSLLSQIRLSSVILVHPTQGVEAFGNISSSLCTLAILLHPCKILRRSSQGNPSVRSSKRKRGIKIE